MQVIQKPPQASLPGRGIKLPIMNKFFAVPKFIDQEHQRRANILVVTQFSVLFLVVAIVIFSYFTTPEHTETLSLGSIGAVAMLISFGLLRKRKLEAASWIIVILGWLVFTVDLAFFAGIRGVSVHGQILMVIFTGLAVGGRSALLMTLLTLTANFIILRMEQLGLLASPLPLPASDTRWFIQTAYTILAAVYIWTADRVIRTALLNSRETADRYRALFEKTNDGVVIYDLDWNVLSTNSQADELLGYSPGELIGLKASKFEDPENAVLVQQRREQLLQGENLPIFEETLNRKDGSHIPVELSMALVLDAAENPSHVQCIMRDITERKLYEDQLQHQALHDPLTNLPNRILFEDHYQRVHSQDKGDQSLVAVLFTDLDNFKNVNDDFGHAIGDQVLQVLGSRLQDSLRESDTVARLGGDEFVIILENIHHKEIVSKIAQKLLKSISKPLKIGEHTFEITASIGIQIAEKGNLPAVDLLKHSDYAMYQVKDSGKNDYRFYDQELNS